VFRQSGLQQILQRRAEIIQAIRSFFIEQGFLEVDTPLRLPCPLPESHIDAEEAGDWYLQTSPESLMKQLLAAGYPKIFQICKCFRKNERGRKHLPEMTLLEWYESGVGYMDLMVQCEEMIRFVACKAGCGDAIIYGSHTIHLNDSWERLSVVDAFTRYAGLSMREAISRDRFDECMAFQIEPELGLKKPVFLYDYPVEKGALARVKPENPLFAERFELYMAGLELCNAFSELTDPVEQEARFKKENAFRASQGKKTYPTPRKFLDALSNMPEAAGIALGVDRLVMLFTDSSEIDAVTSFVPEDL